MNEISPDATELQPIAYDHGILKNTLAGNEIQSDGEITVNNVTNKSPIRRQSHLSPSETNEICNQNSIDNPTALIDTENLILDLMQCDQLDQSTITTPLNNSNDESILNKSIESLSKLVTHDVTVESKGSISSRGSRRKSRIVIRKFQKLDESMLSSTPAPDVKIGQRVAYKEYYGNEFGTIRWIGRVPQICPDWTVGVEFDNAIGEGDGSLNGRRYFIAKDCFAKFLPLVDVKLVDQHVGRPEPGTMISVMSAAVRPGQMISIQRVSTVHVQHCFLNAPHRKPGADLLAVNTRLHCQCPNCGPCAHVIKPPRTQRLARSVKNATHMCQFSTYTCCGMESQEETLCTYEGNKVISLPPPQLSSSAGLPPVGNSWIEGSGYLTNLQFQQSKLMPEEYRLGAAPEDIGAPSSLRRSHSKKSSSRRGSGRRHDHHHRHQSKHKKRDINSNLVIESDPLNPPAEPLDCTDTQFRGNSAENDSAPHDNDDSIQPTTQLTSHSPVPSNNLNQLAVANLEKQVLCDCEKEQQDLNNNEEWNDDGPDRANSNKGKIVYRDSIENRYLFPTDESIDSTFEQDLENLSQARYGRCQNHSSNGHSSKNILIKSLRSLVSCLSARNTGSEFDDMRACVDYQERTTSTIKYSENDRVRNNKSLPIELETEYDDEMIYSGCNKLDGRGNHSISHPDSFTQKNWLPDRNSFGSRCQHSMPRDIQAYSSSDCGFSSASQNSINIHTNPINLQYSLKLNSNDARVYERIISKLMNSTTLTNEDTSKLKSLLGDFHNDHCCLHNKSQYENYSSSDIDQIIADVIKNSYLIKDSNSMQNHKQYSTKCYQASTNYSTEKNNYHPGNEHFEKSSLSRIKEKSNEIPYKYCHGECCSNSPKSVIDGSTAESVTFSSNDSFNSSSGAFEVERKNIKIEAKNNENGSLPKAFELKLTLSINNNDKVSSSTSSNDITKITSNDSACLPDNSKLESNSTPLNGDDLMN